MCETDVTAYYHLSGRSQQISVKPAYFWKEQRKHCSDVLLIAKQIDTHPTCNKSTSYRRSTGNCFSTMIFRGDFFCMFSQEPVWPLTGLHCNALLRLCTLPVVSFVPAVCVLGDLVSYDGTQQKEHYTSSIRALKHNSATSSSLADRSNPDSQIPPKCILL